MFKIGDVVICGKRIGKVSCIHPNSITFIQSHYKAVKTPPQEFTKLTSLVKKAVPSDFLPESYIEKRMLVVKNINYRDIPSYCDVFSISDFEKMCGFVFVNSDGFAKLATESKMSDVELLPSDFKKHKFPDWATHVCWFNK